MHRLTTVEQVIGAATNAYELRQYDEQRRRDERHREEEERLQKRGEEYRADLVARIQYHWGIDVSGVTVGWMSLPDLPGVESYPCLMLGSIRVTFGKDDNTLRAFLANDSRPINATSLAEVGRLIKLVSQPTA